MENSFVAQKSSALAEHCRAEVYTMERGSVFWRLFRPYVHVSFHVLESGAERVLVLKLSAVCPNKYLKSRDEEYSQSVGNTLAVRLPPMAQYNCKPCILSLFNTCESFPDRMHFQMSSRWAPPPCCRCWRCASYLKISANVLHLVSFPILSYSNGDLSLGWRLIVSLCWKARSTKKIGRWLIFCKPQITASGWLTALFQLEVLQRPHHALGCCCPLGTRIQEWLGYTVEQQLLSGEVFDQQSNLWE